MPIPEQRNLDKARGVIRDWLAGQLPDVKELSISPLIGPAFTGFSNETLIFDASWTEGGEPRSEGYVIRVKPTAHTIFLESDFDSQYRVIKALSEHTDVPLPTVHWFEDDESVLGAPFFVMGKVEGNVPSDNPPYTQTGWLLDEATPAVRQQVVESGLDALTRIHQTDWRKLELDFLDKPQYGALGIEQQITYYERSLEWAAQGKPQPIAEAALDWVRANKPSEQHIALAWGDARINNQMFDDDGNVVAVFDWEMVTLADPMMDLAWWLFLDRHFHEGMPAPGAQGEMYGGGPPGVPRMEGFPTREQMLARYEELTGWQPHDIEFYEVFAGLRFAVVMMRIASLVVEFELLPSDTDMGTNNIVTRLLAAKLGLPSPGAEPLPAV
ncbi:MAG TPA: phosphotransferase family protein [Acidimicrobiia bacterium]|nr:phosphotransferase family protein [Acidimicrobiia bacterium]